MRRLTFVLVAAFVLAAATAAPALAAQPYPVSFHQFDLGDPESTSGGVASSGAVTLATSGLDSGTYGDAYGNGPLPYLSGRWTSRTFTTPAPFSELVASWNADTPEGTWIKVEMRARTDKGALTKWYTMGVWSYSDASFRRTSIGHQGDADGYIAIDTFFAKDHLMTAYQLQVTLFRSTGTTATP